MMEAVRVQIEQLHLRVEDRSRLLQEREREVQELRAQLKKERALQCSQACSDPAYRNVPWKTRKCHWPTCGACQECRDPSPVTLSHVSSELMAGDENKSDVTNVVTEGTEEGTALMQGQCPSMFVAVLSSLENAPRRAALRRMWESANDGYDGSIAAKFVICSRDGVSDAIMLESSAYGDLLLLDSRGLS